MSIYLNDEQEEQHNDEFAYPEFMRIEAAEDAARRQGKDVEVVVTFEQQANKSFHLSSSSGKLNKAYRKPLSSIPDNGDELIRKLRGEV